MAYSNDLRKRVIAAVEAGGQTLSQVAKTFQVSESTVDKWMQRRRESGSTQARPWAGGKRRALAGCEACIRAAVRRQPDITLQELCEHVAAETGVVANSSMMSRELALLKLPRKKESPRQPARHAAGQPGPGSVCRIDR
jgi:transposase